MLKEIKFKEVYEYTITVEVTDSENINDVIHEEIPLLIDRTKDEIDDIKENNNFEFYNEYEVTE